MRDNTQRSAEGVMQLGATPSSDACSGDHNGDVMPIPAVRFSEPASFIASVFVMYTQLVIETYPNVSKQPQLPLETDVDQRATCYVKRRQGGHLCYPSM